ncbi:hypothetical protein [Stygiolobus azoricus]|uniref:Uncharacterized protein n=1 Tax=Stygiolobus azoricus TaxID=41675 RepID=A0A650CL73_9CREN|nr:hypothetical protein [Stygiolobus azoricus]QGR18539.1 hypothetical protein D1868_00020 [Stygiolobus azoricus]
MATTIVNMMLVIATILISLVALSLYSVYISYTNSNLSYVNTLESFSKSIQISVSPLTFHSYIDKNFIIYNVSFLASVSIKGYDLNRGQLIIYPFVTNPNPNLYLYVPSGVQEAVINVSKSLLISGNVYLPDGELLGSIKGQGYVVTNDQPFLVSANVTGDKIIVLWVLVNVSSHYYRLGYTYVTPIDSGVGVYVASGSGKYTSSNPQINLNQPLIFSSNKGLIFGLWFNPYVISNSKSMLFNITFNVVSQGGVSVSFVFYTQNTTLFVNQTTYTSNGIAVYKVATIYNKLTQGDWYFLNFSTGSQLVAPNLNLLITLYQNGRLIAEQQFIPVGVSSGNGYASIIQFGNSSSINVISQAVLSTEQSISLSNGPIYNITTQLLENGYLFNNTYNLNWIISHAQNQIYAIVYWYFVANYYPPPSQVPAILWYYGSNGLNEVYLNESGYNTWILI